MRQAITQDFEFPGILRRQIDLKSWDPNTVVGWLEDDFHHFGITLIHRDGIVREVRAVAERYPFTTCGSATAALRDLEGKPLFSRCAEIGKAVDMRVQCTHLFDLAGLLAAHAYHQREHRNYCATISQEPASPPGWLRATLWRDGESVMTWTVYKGVIKHPEADADRPVELGFREWTDAMDEDTAENAFVLRRTVFISRGRKAPGVGHSRSADETGMPPVCHTFQPEYRKLALRIPSSTRRFDEHPDQMLPILNVKP